MVTRTSFELSQVVLLVPHKKQIVHQNVRVHEEKNTTILLQASKKVSCPRVCVSL